MGDGPGQGFVRLNLALCHQKMAQYEKTITFFEQSVVILKDLGDLINLTRASQGLGECLIEKLNELSAAKDYRAQLKITSASSSSR